MLGRIFTVGGYTLLSRLTGLARDIMLAAILGAGPVADAFYVAWRLPNSFRAIFAEGAFNTAFIPAYAHVYGKGGETSARLFANRIFTLLFAAQVAVSYTHLWTNRRRNGSSRLCAARFHPDFAVLKRRSML